ncbi:hypothetical protein HDZ31DRAFT_16584, partial [Schizophyllum fasciatum]
MDFEYTNRPSANTPPVWSTPQKRSHEALNPSQPPFPGSPSAPRFGQNQNIPFIFATPRDDPPPMQSWVPPTGFSATQAFSQPEVHDVDMAEASPPKPEDTRPVAAGALRRVFKARQKSRDRRAARINDEDDADDSDDQDEGGKETRLSRAGPTSNHFTLNMPSPAAPQSDVPYVLLGYLQFFFNLSLILVFLYLLLQFILTVQRDVEQRISEYSM